MWASLPLASSPEHCLPRIQFLFIGSRLCSTLLSNFTSRLGPCASLSLHLHLVVKRTCTSKLSDMLGTPKSNGPPNFRRAVFLINLFWESGSRLLRRGLSHRRLLGRTFFLR